MLLLPAHPRSEHDLAYWRGRVASLEVLICELLAKNQRLRMVFPSVEQEDMISGGVQQERTANLIAQQSMRRSVEMNQARSRQ